MKWLDFLNWTSIIKKFFDGNAIISGKQYKILNSKLNSILQLLNDSARKSTFSGEEVELLLKSIESQTRTLVYGVINGMDERLATHSRTFNHEIEKL